MTTIDQRIFETLIDIRDDVRRRIKTEPGHAIPHHSADEWLRQKFEEAMAHRLLTEFEMREHCIALEAVRLTTRVLVRGEGRSTGQIVHEATTLATEAAERLGGWDMLYEDWNRDPEEGRS